MYQAAPTFNKIDKCRQYFFIKQWKEVRGFVKQDHRSNNTQLE